MRRIIVVLLVTLFFAVGLFTAAVSSKPPAKKCNPHRCPTTITAPTTTTIPTTTTTPTTTSSGYTIPSSIPSDCSIDVSSQILNWLAGVPNGQTATFRNGCYRVESTLELNNRNLTLAGSGVTLRSLNPPEDQRPIWRFISSNVAVSNMTLLGSYTSGGTLNDSLQHAHGFDLRGTKADISNVTIRDMAGDCVYFGLGYDNITRSSGRFNSSTCDSIGRNGVSVTAGDNITIDNNSISSAGLDGVDIEPNQVSGNWGSDNVAVSNNIFASIHLNAYSIVENAPISDQSFTNNMASGPLKVAVAPVTSTYYRPSAITVRDNSGGTGSHLSFEHVDGLSISGNDGTISISDCTNVTT